jgi:hypothetical protein
VATGTINTGLLATQLTTGTLAGVDTLTQASTGYMVKTSSVTGNIIATTGIVEVGANKYDLAYTTYTLDMPIALSSNTETGDFGEFESASSFTIVGVFFTSRTTAPISNITFTVQRQTNGLNLMNGSMLLTGGLTQSAVFVSTGNMIPQNGGIRVVATGRSNGIVHAVFTVYKQRGQ